MVVFNGHAEAFEEDRPRIASELSLAPGSDGEAMIQITSRASTHIRRMLAKRSLGEIALRLGVKAGGCSGFEYTFAWEAAPKPGDSIFETADGAQVMVDPKSLRLLDGIVLDYDTSLVSRGFLIDNPQAKSTCGCGTSFSVEDPTARLAEAGKKES